MGFIFSWCYIVESIWPLLSHTPKWIDREHVVPEEKGCPWRCITHYHYDRSKYVNDSVESRNLDLRYQSTRSLKGLLVVLKNYEATKEELFSSNSIFPFNHHSRKDTTVLVKTNALLPELSLYITENLDKSGKYNTQYTTNSLVKLETIPIGELEWIVP